MKKKDIKAAISKGKPWNQRFIKSDKCTQLIDALQYYNWITLEGAAQCGKSSILALLFAMVIMSSGPNDNLFLAIGYTIASAKTNIADVSGFGLKAIFDGRWCDGKYNGKDALFINVNGVTKTVVFCEAANVSSNNSWHGFSISGAACDEIDRWHQNSIDELRQRVQAHPNAKVIISLNSTNINHPIYKFFDELISRGKMFLMNFTFLDNPGLTDEEKEQILSSYDPDSVFYKRYVLGQRVSIEGLIYKLTEKNYINYKDFNYTSYVVVCDPGKTTSCSAFACVGLTYNPEKEQLECHVINDYNQRNGSVNNTNFRTTRDIANDYVEFIIQCMKKLDRAPAAIYCDTDPDFYVECKTALAAHNLGYFNIQYVLKSYDDMRIEDRIRWSSSALFNGRLRFDTECKDTINEFKETVYDPKALLSGREIYYDNPSDDSAPHIDNIDATLYGYRHYKDTLDNQYKYEY